MKTTPKPQEEITVKQNPSAASAEEQAPTPPTKTVEEAGTAIKAAQLDSDDERSSSEGFSSEASSEYAPSSDSSGDEKEKKRS